MAGATNVVWLLVRSHLVDLPDMDVSPGVLKVVVAELAGVGVVNKTSEDQKCGEREA